MELKTIVTPNCPEYLSENPRPEMHFTLTRMPDTEPLVCKKRREGRQKKKSYYHN